MFNQSCTETSKLCMSPPMAFAFELVDKISGENLFTNGTFFENQIEVSDNTTNTLLDYHFINEDYLNVFFIYDIGWQTEIIDCTIKVAGEVIFTLYIDAERLTEDGCEFTLYNEITIENCEYELDTNTGFYKILIE